MNLSWRECYQKYPQICQILGLALLWLVVMMLVFSLLRWPLNWQLERLNKQTQELQLLSQLPAHWQHQVKMTDITDLIAELSKHWQALLPAYKDVQFEQVNHHTLRCRVQQIDEQAFMQWLWVMQKQYPFRVSQLRLLPAAEHSGLLNIEYSLEII